MGAPSVEVPSVPLVAAPFGAEVPGPSETSLDGVASVVVGVTEEQKGATLSVIELDVREHFLSAFRSQLTDGNRAAA